MALTTYLARTSQLLQNPAAPTALYSTSLLTGYINQARGQVAIEGECVRTIGTISTVVDQRNYNFSGINIGVAATTGRGGVVNVQTITYSIASGQQWITPRAWPWFQLYCNNNVVPESGLPETWAQFGQGSGTGSISSATGTFYLDPPPDLVYTLNCDCVCYPIDLTDDSTVEAIPYPWTDAVSYFAAYLALLSAQTSVRMNDAQRMFQLYGEFLARARQFANPSVNRHLYSQSVDPTSVNKLGLQPKAQQGQG